MNHSCAALAAGITKGTSSQYLVAYRGKIRQYTSAVDPANFQELVSQTAGRNSFRHKRSYCSLRASIGGRPSWGVCTKGSGKGPVTTKQRHCPWRGNRTMPMSLVFKPRSYIQKLYDCRVSIRTALVQVVKKLSTSSKTQNVFPQQHPAAISPEC